MASALGVIIVDYRKMASALGVIIIVDNRVSYVGGLEWLDGKVKCGKDLSFA
jgi:hypothetical protein